MNMNMNINISTNYNKIDIPKTKKYNVNIPFSGQIKQDAFSHSEDKIRTSMNINDELKKLKEADRFKGSLVDFVPNILTSYFDGKMLQLEFANRFTRKMNSAKFYFSQMPNELIKENKEVFKNELILADTINSILLKQFNQEPISFDSELGEAIKTYNNSYEDGALGI